MCFSAKTYFQVPSFLSYLGLRLGLRFGLRLRLRLVQVVRSLCVVLSCCVVLLCCIVLWYLRVKG